MPKKWTIVSLSFLFCVASIGTMLRGIKYFELPFDYMHLVHAHSHVAFQGWVYTLMLLLLPTFYLSTDHISKSRYQQQFILTVGIVLGILVSFSLWGYGLYSILFSTLLQFAQYVFVFKFFQDIKQSPSENQNQISLRFVKAGLLLGMLSTLGPWVIGALSANGMGDTEAYHSTIYFLLHFQYNGWFIFVALGLFFKCLERAEVQYDYVQAKRFFIFLLISVFPAYALSLLGMSFRDLIIIPGVLAGLLQIVACVLFVKTINCSVRTWFTTQTFWLRGFLMIAFLSFLIKSGLQLLSVLPVVETIAFGSRNAIMAYMHLCLIGLISFTLIAVLCYLKWVPNTLTTRVGSGFWIFGFIGSEILLAASGLGLFFQFDLLFAFSAVMALGICLLLFTTLLYSKN